MVIRKEVGVQRPATACSAIKLVLIVGDNGSNMKLFTIFSTPWLCTLQTRHGMEALQSDNCQTIVMDIQLPSLGLGSRSGSSDEELRASRLLPLLPSP